MFFSRFGSAGWSRRFAETAAPVHVRRRPFSDTFYLIGAGLIVALIASLLLKKPSGVSEGGAH